MKQKYKDAATAMLFVLSVALITIGLATKQPSHVMKKAVQICLECIGIG